VLLVEDNEINQQVAMEILTAVGVDVSDREQRPGSSGCHPGESLRCGVDGRADADNGRLHPATRTVRGDQRFHDLPIIAMTAHAMTRDQEKSFAAGMNDHVTKPIDRPQLFATLAKWVPARRATPPEEPTVAGVPERVHCRDPDQRRCKAPAPSMGVGTGARNEERGMKERRGVFRRRFPALICRKGCGACRATKCFNRKLLLSFAAGYAQTTEEIRRVLDAGDYDQAHHLVHSIKGVAGNLAAGELQTAAMGLERLVKHADKDTPPSPESLHEALVSFS